MKSSPILAPHSDSITQMASAGEPKSPTLEQLPKISADLKQEVTKDHPLKHVEVVEKNVLPTEEGKASGGRDLFPEETW